MIRLEINAPAPFITSNQRIHRMEKARRTKLWREAARLAALDAPPFACPVHILAYVRKPRGGRWDPLNWADTAKAAVDGVASAETGLTDDDHTNVLGPDMRWHEPGPAALILEITPL